MVLLDYQKMCHPFVDPSNDPIDVLLYRGLGKHVHTVMVNGRIVLQDGKLLTIDEEAIASRLAEAASRPRTDKEKALVQTMDELERYVIRYYEGWAKKIRTEPFFMTNSRIDGLL
jgi:5-methylthioadenosine/S-adenosylhomocysteine deaminase